MNISDYKNMEHKYSIKADVFGKIKYWNLIDGLHSASGRKGHSMYPSIKSARAEIKKLKRVFHNGIKFFVIEEKDIPFIKKQIR